MTKAQVLLELQDNHIEKMWAKAGNQEFARVHLTPKDNDEFIKIIIKSVSGSREVIKPRKATIGKEKL